MRTLLAAFAALALSAAPAAAATVPVDPGAAALEGQLQAAIAAVSPSIAQIRTEEGLGSGIVLDGQGNIVTNAHVVGGSETAKVTLADGKRHPAVVKGSFPALDLAVVHVSDATPAPAAFADSSSLKLGQVVLALGSPYGLRGSVTQGIVSALNRTLAEDEGTLLGGLIQTSAPIFPGNSGGALVNLAGEVVGIPTLGADQAGIGFAIPSSTAVAIGRQLAADGRVAHSGLASLGLLAAPVRGGGLRVLSVEKGGPAAKAGIAAGTRILRIGGRRISTGLGAKRTLLTHRPGETIALQVRTGAATRDVAVVLGELTVD